MLGVICGCAVLLTWTLMATSSRLRRTLTRLDALLPECGRAVKQTRVTLGKTEELLDHGNAAVRHAEVAAQVIRELTTDLLSQLHLVEERTRGLVTRYFGNGMREEPRRHARSRNGTGGKHHA